MSKVAPWHSVKPGTNPVHHDNNKCTEGNNIESQYRRPGTGNRRLCDHCKRLDTEGQ